MPSPLFMRVPATLTCHDFTYSFPKHTIIQFTHLFFSSFAMRTKLTPLTVDVIYDIIQELKVIYKMYIIICCGYVWNFKIYVGKSGISSKSRGIFGVFPKNYIQIMIFFEIVKMPPSSPNFT